MDKEKGKIYAVCNQKGGVGKTLTAVSLGIGLAREGKRVLLVDIDPQGSLTAINKYDAILVFFRTHIKMLKPAEIGMRI